MPPKTSASRSSTSWTLSCSIDPTAMPGSAGPHQPGGRALAWARALGLVNYRHLVMKQPPARLLHRLSAIRRALFALRLCPENVRPLRRLRAKQVHVRPPHCTVWTRKLSSSTHSSSAITAFAPFPVRAASDRGAALSANTGVPIVSNQHRVTKALAMEVSLEVVHRRIQLRKVGFRTALHRESECCPPHRRSVFGKAAPFFLHFCQRLHNHIWSEDLFWSGG